MVRELLGVLVEEPVASVRLDAQLRVGPTGIPQRANAASWASRVARSVD